jgi:hypothetical protein
MHPTRITISLALLLLASLACNAATGIRTAQTEIPTLLTQAPTTVGAIETAAAKFTPPAAESTATPSKENPTQAAGTTPPSANETPSAGGLGIKLEDVKTIMQLTQQFSFSDGTVDGKTASTARLTSTAATSFPTLATGFSAVFIGDAQNLSEIKVTLPRTEDQASVDEGVGLMSVMFAGILPADVQVEFLMWLAQNYAKIQVNSSQETTVKNFKFTLSRTTATVLLDIVPVK